MPMTEASTPVLLVDREGVIEHANHAAERLLGACVGRSCSRTLRPRSAEGTIVCEGGCPRAHREGGVRWPAVVTHEQVAELECSVLGDRVVVTMRGIEPRPPALQRLTPRERTVLTLLASGMNTSGIAEELGIARSTARTHVERCRLKLGAKSQAEAVVRAYKTHQIEL